jgi:F-type H+-transporting ATPase subunit b
MMALVAVLIALLPLLAPNQVLAQPPEGHEANAKGQDHSSTAGSKHAAEEKKEMDIFGKSLDLAIWTWIVFFALLFILGKYAWGPMLEGLKKREHNIQSALEEAKRSQEESQRLRDDMSKQMADAQAKIKAAMDDARRDAQRTADELIAKAKNEIQAERQRLHREVGIARDQALEAISARTAELATLVASKALGRGIELRDHQRLIDEAIGELGTQTKVR